jgi:selenocysteine lyase/cysteine desulfurase
MAGLAAALAELTAVGIAAIADRALALAQRIRDWLAEGGYALASAGNQPGSASTIVGLSCPEPRGSQILSDLAAAGVQVSIPDGLIRISPHYWTTDEEVELLLAEIARSAPLTLRNG